jgi:hypothetical protein
LSFFNTSSRNSFGIQKQRASIRQLESALPLQQGAGKGDGSAIHHTLNSALGRKWCGLPDPRNTLRRSGCDGWSFCDFDLAR